MREGSVPCLFFYNSSDLHDPERLLETGLFTRQQREQLAVLGVGPSVPYICSYSPCSHRFSMLVKLFTYSKHTERVR